MYFNFEQILSYEINYIVMKIIRFMHCLKIIFKVNLTAFDYIFGDFLEYRYFEKAGNKF